MWQQVVKHHLLICSYDSWPSRLMKLLSSSMKRLFASPTDGSDRSPEAMSHPTCQLDRTFRHKRSPVSLCLRCVIPTPLFIRLYDTISLFSSRVIIEKKCFNGKFRAGLPAPNKKTALHLQGVIIQTGSIVLFHGFIILGQAPLCQ